MTGYRASASADAAPMPDTVLICGVNWVGDAIMTMPALQVFRARHPACRICLLIKPALLPLWKMHAAPNEVWRFEPGIRGLWRAARAARAAGIGRSYALPHSVRSAVPPWLAGVPDRRGLPGPGRKWLLTKIATPTDAPDRRHQVYEYMDLLAPDEPQPPPPAVLSPGPAARESIRRFFDDDRAPWIGLIPGAARGPSKRWPAERFAAVGRRLAADRLGRVAVFGSSAERELCSEVARAIGPSALSLAGKTSLEEWAALLQLCRLVIANDSGGAHLAAALGAPVVAVFGATDPARTAPFGARGRWLQAPGIAGRRDIAPDDPRARAALEAVSVDEVYGAARDLLAETSHRFAEAAR